MSKKSNNKANKYAAKNARRAAEAARKANAKPLYSEGNSALYHNGLMFTKEDGSPITPEEMAKVLEKLAPILEENGVDIEDCRFAFA